MPKRIVLTAYQAQWLADLVYEEHDRVRTGNTIYPPNKEETLADLQEIMDLLKDAQEDGA